MKEQTEAYLILKPISERFNKIAKEITDSEIKSLMKDTLRERLKSEVDFSGIQELVDNFMEEREDDIKEMIMESLKRKL